MERERLETDKASGYYDDEQGILFVTYRDVISPDTTAQVYAWIGRLLATEPDAVMRARGSIYDFSEVMGIDSRNLTSAQRQSQQLNTKVDMSSHPVALVVTDPLQEQLLRVTMKISPQQERKRIVRTMEEAHAFINSFYPVRQNKAEPIKP
jgi:hypothetical protein